MKISTLIVALLLTISYACAQPVIDQSRAQWRVSPDGLVEAKTLQQDKNASMGLLRFSTGAKVPLHRHPKSTEMLYLRSGSGFMILDGKMFEVKAGSVVRVPQGAEHSFEATADGEAVQVYAPSGPELRFQKWKPK